MVYKNVEMAGNVIRITKSPNVALLVVFTIVVVVNVFVISVLLTVFPGWIRLALCGFLIVTWCALLLGQKTVTTFNADTRVVTVWNRLKKTRRIPFDEVGAVEFIGHAEACEKGGEVLRLTPPGNRFGRGTIITRNYPEADPELAFFRHVVVPAIAVMLGHEQDVESAEGATDTVRRLPDEPEFFTKHGGIYRRWNLLALVFPSFFAVAFPTLTAIHWHIMLAALGAACLLMALALPCRVELDSDRREVREYKAYGFFVSKRFSFDSYRELKVVRVHHGGSYIGIRVDMRFSGTQRRITVARVVFTHKVERLLRETEDIMLAGRQ